MSAYPLTALLTLLIVLMLHWTGMRVGHARRQSGIMPPATNGDPQLERCLRVQANTLEALATFLPTLWLCAVFCSDRIAACAGALWLGARIWYALAYAKDASLRIPPFAAGVTMLALTWLGTLAGVVQHWL